MARSGTPKISSMRGEASRSRPSASKRAMPLGSESITARSSAVCRSASARSARCRSRSVSIPRISRALRTESAARSAMAVTKAMSSLV